MGTRKKIQYLLDSFYSYLKSNGGLKAIDEMYKWEIVANFKGRPNLYAEDFVREIKDWSKAMRNLLYTGMQPTALRHMAEERGRELQQAISILFVDNLPLDAKVTEYITSCDKIWDASMKKKFGANTQSRMDERLISDLLTCYNPQEYTFYKDSVYKSLCDYLAIEKRKTKTKLSHFYELIKDICLPIYKEQTELKKFIDDEVISAGYEPNDLLSIQTALYLMSENQLDLNGNNTPTNMQESKYDHYIKLLKANRNIVLTGAPGTGKTFLAKEIAKAMNAENDFVQFHPSYDYTDFVEGLRPTKSNNDTIGFEPRDGIFKEFCIKALRNIVDNAKSQEEITAEKELENEYYDWIDRINNGEETTLPLKTANATMDIVRISSNNNIIFKASHSVSNTEYTISLGRLLKLATVFKTIKDLDSVMNIDREVRNVIGGCNSSCYWAALRYLYSRSILHLSPIYDDDAVAVKKKLFVFIIDEINRGEISKIFGELFFSIDPGYRGIEGRVRTQYANLCDIPNDFDDYISSKGESVTQYGHFFVPDNVYIIGTMNDIDRSVESMDFAMRRRFTWVEVSAEERAIDMGVSQENLDIMKRVNKAICETDGLGKDYELGGAYFKDDTNLKDRWEYRLKGLLKEYLRGVNGAEKKLKDLENVYNGKTDADNNADGQ